MESLGIIKVESVHWYVRDMARTRRFYTELMDFAELGESSPELTARGRQHSVVFKANDVQLICSAPVGEGGRAWRWLQKHPEGVGTVNFLVKDVEKTWKLLESRGGTIIDDGLQRFTDDKGGRLAFFSITTPFGNTTFRFIQRDGYEALYPGFVRHAAPRGGTNRFGFGKIDHITSNFRTLQPMVLWMKHVMGFEEFWNIQFHTEEEIEKGNQHGTGLKSQVMWDPHSTVKFANNEPSRPRFKQSQINVFVEDQRGEGIQHLALLVRDIVPAVREMRKTNGLDFLGTPAAYYDYLPERIQKSGIARIDERIDELRELQILIDGHKEHQYLLQIFMKENGHLMKDREAGPFFYEIIERKGDKGFGGGNFKALFESIERAQAAARAS
ncbi:MAG: VOC family protein [Myxococcaceae bacterium]|jgi:4-hydroxyphenylpyruvate dioxygenase|nr:VOC family protein [Myxococcaceae bacterium]